MQSISRIQPFNCLNVDMYHFKQPNIKMLMYISGNDLTEKWTDSRLVH